jgi:hypothetical protein
MSWDNTRLFGDDTDAHRAFRPEVREWVTANCPASLRHRPDRIEPPALKLWHRKLAERSGHGARDAREDPRSRRLRRYRTARLRGDAPYTNAWRLVPLA